MFIVEAERRSERATTNVRPTVCRLVQTRLRKREYRPIGGETAVFPVGRRHENLFIFFQKITLAAPYVRSAVSFTFNGALRSASSVYETCEMSGLCFDETLFCVLGVHVQNGCNKAERLKGGILFKISHSRVIVLVSPFLNSMTYPFIPSTYFRDNSRESALQTFCF